MLHAEVPRLQIMCAQPAQRLSDDHWCCLMHGLRKCCASADASAVWPRHLVQLAPNISGNSH